MHPFRRPSAIVRRCHGIVTAGAPCECSLAVYSDVEPGDRNLWSKVPPSFFWSRSFFSQAANMSRNKRRNLGNDLYGLQLPLGYATDSAVASQMECLSEGKESEGSVDALRFLRPESDTITVKCSRRVALCPLAKVILKCHRKGVGAAVGKWIEGGNELKSKDVFATLFNLHQRRLFWKALQFSEWLEKTKCVELDEQTYALHIDSLAKVHGIQSAEDFIEKIPQTFRTELIYGTLLANSVAQGNAAQAEDIFRRMQHMGFPLTAIACNQLLLLYKRVDRRKIGPFLLMMHNVGIKPSLVTYKFLVSIKGSEADISSMEIIVESMKASGVKPDNEILAVMAKNYVIAGFERKAEETMRQLEGGDVEKNRAACRLLLPLYASLGRLDEVERIWKVCESKPSLRECLSAIEACRLLRRVDIAEKLFDTMMKTWKLSGNAYYAMLKLYFDLKIFSKGKALAKMMLDGGCRVKDLTLDVLVKLHVELGEVEEAESMLQDFTERKLGRPFYSSYLVLLKFYAKKGEVSKAEEIFDTMRTNGYIGRMSQYEALLEAYVNAKVPIYGFRERMEADKMFPNKAMAARIASISFEGKTD